MADNVYMYNINYGKTINGAIEAVKTYFMSENMETQYFQRNDCHIIQARARNGGLKKIVGMDKAVEVRLTPIDDHKKVTVEIGGAKWADKAAVMAVSMFVLWPLAVTSGVGIYGQNKIIKKARSILESYFNG